MRSTALGGCLTLAGLSISSVVNALGSQSLRDPTPPSQEDPSKRLAVVVPAYRGDLDRAVSSLERWPANCSPTTEQQVDLVLYYAEGEEEDIRAVTVAADSISKSAGRCFSKTRTVYAHLNKEVRKESHIISMPALFALKGGALRIEGVWICYTRVKNRASRASYYSHAMMSCYISQLSSPGRVLLWSTTAEGTPHLLIVASVLSLLTFLSTHPCFQRSYISYIHSGTRERKENVPNLHKSACPPSTHPKIYKPTRAKEDAMPLWITVWIHSQPRSQSLDFYKIRELGNSEGRGGCKELRHGPSLMEPRVVANISRQPYFKIEL